MAVMLMTTTCFAAGDTSAVTQPLDNLKTLIIAVIGAVGVIILAKNVMEFAQAYQQQDSSTMNSALKGVVAGVIMAGISGVLAFLGCECRMTLRYQHLMLGEMRFPKQIKERGE